MQRMRRSGTWLLAVAVAVLVAAATVDAVLGDEAAAPARKVPERQRVDERAELVRAARARGISGTLLYADEGCAIRSIRLPGLNPAEGAPSGTSCAFTTSPGGLYAPGTAVPSPRAQLIAECIAGGVEVRQEGELLGRAPGCAPAWTPDGRLTAVRDGELVELRRRGSRVLLSRRDVARALARDPWAFADPRVREAAWLDDDLVAVVVSDPGREKDDVIALFRGRRLVGAPPFPYERLSGLRVSPRGSFVAARVGLPAVGLVVLDRRAELVAIPFRIARAIAWSYDETWTAVASPDSIYVWETGERALRFIRLPIRARDLIWR